MADKEIPDKSLWLYKGMIYRVITVHQQMKSQDTFGNWVATVEYEAESKLNMTFARPITDFTSKFRKYN